MNKVSSRSHAVLQVKARAAAVGCRLGARPLSLSSLTRTLFWRDQASPSPLFPSHLPRRSSAATARR